MCANESDPTARDADELLRRLFDIAARRLSEREIQLHYSESVIKWLLERESWRQSCDPLRCLDGEWHRHIAAAIEALLLNRELRPQDMLYVTMDGERTESRLKFEVIA